MLPSSRKTAFEIVAAYFVNVYDNELYQKAKVRKESGNSPSITEAYQECATCYIQAFRDRSKKPEESYYRKIILNMLKFYQLWSSYSTVTLAEFIDTVVRHLTPTEKYQNMDNFAKDRLLRDALTSVVSKFTVSTVGKHLRIIIDNRDVEHRNVRTLQNLFIQLMEDQRQHIFELFIEAGAGPSGRQRAEGVSVAVVNKMKDMLKKTLEEKSELQIRLSDYDKNVKKIIEQLKEQIRLRDVEIQEKDSQISGLKQTISNFDEQIFDSENEDVDTADAGMIEYEDGAEDDDDVDDDGVDGITEDNIDDDGIKLTTRSRRSGVNFIMPEDDMDFLNFE